MDICTYTEEFQKLSVRSKFAEPKSIKVARYLNGLRLNIQEELQLLSPNTVAKCYQLALKVDEKIKSRQKRITTKLEEGNHLEEDAHLEEEAKIISHKQRHIMK